MMKITPILLQKIQVASHRHELIQKNDRLLVAFSGGPDSVAAVLLLLKLKNKFSLDIATAHLDHAINPKNSQHFLKFSKKMSQDFKIPIFTQQVNIRNLSVKNKRSLEDEGRAQRYLFLEKIATKHGFNKIVTAHTLDDQAETVILRLCRGAGIAGLAAIPWKRQVRKKLEVIRPLLGIRKKELLSFLSEEKASFVLDPSNRSKDFTRNKVRHEVLPYLEKKLNPNLKSVLAQLADISSEISSYIDVVAQSKFRKSLIQLKPKKMARLAIGQLKPMPPAILREVIRHCLFLLKGDLKRFDFDHIMAATQVILSQKSQSKLDFPGRVRLVKKSNYLEFHML